MIHAMPKTIYGYDIEELIALAVELKGNKITPKGTGVMQEKVVRNADM